MTTFSPWNRGEFDMMDRETASQLTQENITLRHDVWLVAKAERDRISAWVIKRGHDDLARQLNFEMDWA